MPSSCPRRLHPGLSVLPLAVLPLAVLLLAAAADGHEEIPAYLADDPRLGESLNVSLVGSLQVEPPWEPEQGGFFSTTDLYVVGDYAYMGSNRALLHVIDISRPEVMRLVAQVPMPGPALDVKVNGELAVVAVQNGPVNELGVVVVDISDPPRARIVGQYSDPLWSGVHNLYLDGGRAYLAHSASRGISVLDLSEPSRPFVSGTWINDDPGFGSIIHDIFIRDGIAYLSDLLRGTGGLVLLDLSDPDRPVTLSSFEIEEGLHNCFTGTGYVYCNQELGGWRQPLHIIDVTDPQRPVEAATFRMKRTSVYGGIGPHNTWIDGDLLYWAFYDGGLRILDVSDPLRPVEIGSYRTPYAWTAQPHDDGLIYVADARLSSIRAFRFDRPAYAVRSASASESTLPAGGGQPFDLRARVEPARAAPAGRVRQVRARLLPDRDGSQWILRDDGEATDERGGDGVYSGVVRLSPQLLSGIYHLEVQAEDETGGIYPFSDLPLNLFPVRDLDLFDDAVSVPGAEFHLSGGAEGPLFPPEAPVFRGARSAAFHVDPDNSEGWHIDLHFHEHLDFLGYSALRFAFHPGTARGTSLALELGEYTLPLAGRRSFRRIDLSRPEWQVVEIPLDPFERDRTVPNVSFIGNLEGTFYVDDLRMVSKVTAPTGIDEQVTETTPEDVVLEQSYPNPFNASTAIRFFLPRPQAATLRVYSAAGQPLATLVDARLAAGTHLVRWDGRDDAGRRLASGVYLYRLRVGDQLTTRKLLLLK